MTILRCREPLRTRLRPATHSVVTASNGETALDLLSEETVDLVLLDVGLPGIDGHEVIRRFRTWSDTPVIMLSVQDTPEGKINALDSGADDYITKPFDTRELLARMRAVLRRSGAEEGEPAVLDFGELVIDLRKQLVRLSGRGPPPHADRVQVAPDHGGQSGKPAHA